MIAEILERRFERRARSGASSAAPPARPEYSVCDMHEFALCEGMLEAVRKRAAGRPVAGMRVRCGVRHAVDAAAMAQAFGLVAAGTEAPDAAVDLVTVPVTVACRDCGRVGESADLPTVCKRCNGVNIEISGGDELILESIRYTSAAP